MGGGCTDDIHGDEKEDVIKANFLVIKVRKEQELLGIHTAMEF